MKLVATALCGVFAMTAMSGSADQPDPAYRNRNLPVEQRVSDLIGRMTLEEKIEEIISPPVRHIVDPTGKFDDAFAVKAFAEANEVRTKLSAADWAILRNGAQRYRMEKTRLGIPLLFRGEGLHGFMAYGATMYPQALGLASTWDPSLIRRVFEATADEMSAAGVNQAFAPVLDLARDPRWGRTEETYGEDPYLVTKIGMAAIQGLQGPGWAIDRQHVSATAKHFAVHGQPESGTNIGPANYSEREIRNTFLVPFRAAVDVGQVGSFMASYNEVDGMPSHANTWLLDDILRREWGYKGYVIADYMGIQKLVTDHFVAADLEDAARQALTAGVDLDDVDGSAYLTLAKQVREGKVVQSLVDRAAGHILATKFRLGLFDEPYVDPARAVRAVGSTEHRALALEAAEKSIVLLKNQGKLLPLSLDKYKTIAVVGPNAADVHLGGYSREPEHAVGIRDGIRTRAGSAAKIVYSEGARITEGPQGWAGWYDAKIKAPDPAEERRRIRAAVEVVRKSDVAIVVVGENEQTNREGWDLAVAGDRDSLDLIGFQEDLIRSIVATGKPVVVVLINGRPLSIRYAAEHVPAIVEGWYLGQEGGTALARVLFGDVNPGGRLPITFPRSVGQVPAFYNHKPSRNRSYVLADREPLFPFGAGLSYTTFRYENVKVSPAVIDAGGEATVSVDVVNTGDRTGDDVPQMYVRQQISSVTRPVKELRGFSRITLKPGERRTVTFRLGRNELQVFNRDMKWAVEPGAFTIMVGPNSAETSSVVLQVSR